MRVRLRSVGPMGFCSPAVPRNTLQAHDEMHRHRGVYLASSGATTVPSMFPNTAFTTDTGKLPTYQINIFHF